MKIIYISISCIFILTLFLHHISRGADEESSKTSAIDSLGITGENLLEDMKYLEDERMKALKEKEAILEKKEMELTEKEKQLKKLKEEIKVETKKLANIQASVNKMMATLSEDSAKRVAKLAKIYESMKGDNAARIIVELYQKDKEIAIEVIKKMSPRKSGKILDAMTGIDKKTTANISYEISKKKRFLNKSPKRKEVKYYEQHGTTCGN
jgi:flagellar motility protein MotE (MotC chaperone)